MAFQTPGTIKSIKLQNFMCHPNFEVPFGPNVNFIIGPNGSGKSAILTALVVALGGRATVTSRAKRMSEFIKYGERWAKICVVLHNYEKLSDKQYGFKPDDYGKFITVEKIIYRDEPAKLVLKNDADRKVSDRKSELDEMIDHFGILINNPICILNQEVSKTFLHSKKPEDKFDLFMKATTLEQIEIDYNEAVKRHQEWFNSNENNNTAFMLLDKEYMICKEKTDFLQNRTKLNERKQHLDCELVYTISKDTERGIQEVEKKIQSIKKDIQKAEKVIEDRNEKITKFNEEIEVYKSKIKLVNEQLEESKSKSRDIMAQETENKSKQVTLNCKITQSMRKIERATEDVAVLEKSIEDSKRELRAKNALDNDSEQRKLDIEQLEKELKYDNDKEKNLRLHTEQLNHSMTSLRTEMQTAGMHKSELKTNINSCQANLSRLQNGQKNAIRRFGDFVLKIREEIDKAYAEGRFKHKPIGPLGFYIKLKSPEIAAPLECHMKKFSHAFTCDNSKDMATLLNIFRKLSQSRDYRQPSLITRPFVRRHDVSKFKVEHPTYKTFLDYIMIEDDSVFNVIADKCQLESVLYVPDYYEAEALMIDERRVPKNTRLAYTKDCQVMHPKTPSGGFKSFANDAKKYNLFSDSNVSLIREKELEIKEITVKLHQAEEVYRNLERSMAVQRQEYEATQAEIRNILADIRKKEEKLIILKTTVTVQPQVLSDLEDELAQLVHLIETENLIIDGLKEQSALLQKELKDIRREKEEISQKIQLREKSRLDHYKVLEDTKASIEDAQNTIKSKEIQIQNRTKDIASREAELDELQQMLVRNQQRLEASPADWEPPRQVRKLDVVREEIRKIQNQLRIEEDEEMSDPHELMDKLQKRMKEIENLSTLKDLNLSNHSLASKSLGQRKEGVETLRRNTISAVSTTFTAVMRSNNMDGKLLIHLDDVYEQGELAKKGRTLEMRIDTNYTPTQRPSLVMNENNNTRTSRSQPAADMGLHSRAKRARVDYGSNEKENEVKMTDARSLSGGERSFSTVAFVLSLWHHCSSPFKLMDEIDVFMDMVTRRVSYNALIRFAQISEDAGQHIFFSPLELPKIDDSNNIVRVFEMPAIIRKRPHSQVAGAGGDETAQV